MELLAHTRGPFYMSKQPLKDSPETQFDPTARDLLDAKEWEHWLKMPAWTIKEFACLINSIDPDEAERTIGIFRKFERSSNNNVSFTFRMLDRARVTKEINDLMEPGKFVKWAMNRGLNIPSEMKSLSNENTEISISKKVEGKLFPKREISLYNVIYALAKEKYIPMKNSTLPKTLENILLQQEIRTPDHETIKDVLEEAFRRAEAQKASK